jgi:hypothetical protein
MMVGVLDRWRQSIDRACAQLSSVDDEPARLRPKPDQWCIKELIGHLIDSAVNNHRRFVLAQLQDELVFPGYDQDEWVRVQKYQDAPWPQLVEAWAAANRRLIEVVRVADAKELERPRAKHNLSELAYKDPPTDRAPTLAWFIEDYVDHLDHHLGQIRALVPSRAHRRPA